MRSWCVGLSPDSVMDATQLQACACATRHRFPSSRWVVFSSPSQSKWMQVARHVNSEVTAAAACVQLDRKLPVLKSISHIHFLHTTYPASSLPIPSYWWHASTISAACVHPLCLASSHKYKEIDYSDFSFDGRKAGEPRNIIKIAIKHRMFQSKASQTPWYWKPEAKKIMHSDLNWEGTDHA